eukprot:13842228-Ditylum_brightwellii.AAC.1
MDQEEMLEILENGIPTRWKLEWIRKACEPSMHETKVAAFKYPSEKEGKLKAKHKVEENYHNWGQAPQQHAIIANIMGLAGI